MPNEHIQAWITALRSGEYQQTKQALHDSRGFCCVGVECDVADPNGWVLGSGPTPIYGFISETDGEPELGVVPHTIMKLSGLSRRFYAELYEMNDDSKKTFKEIAGFIEASVADGTAFK